MFLHRRFVDARACRVELSPVWGVVGLLALAVLSVALPCSAQDTAGGWPTYGGDPGGQRYSSAKQITPENVQQLVPAWTFHTGALAKKRPGAQHAAFEATPILFRGLLYFTTPWDEIFALDPETGAQRWMYDPVLRRNQNIGLLTSRGVAAWQGKDTGPCSSRIFVATFDSRLIAVDAQQGTVCTGFGSNGEVDLSKDVYFKKDTPFYNTSPPTVIGNLVVVGSGIADNIRVDAEAGVVRAFDCVTGKLVWTWEPIPWAKQQKLRTGAANAWSVIAADPAHHLLFVPTGAPSPDFYGGMRPGDDRDANSVVALDATTGRRVWGFQVVHHDLWDYDVAAEPLLFTFRGRTPAIAITTKQGLVFVLNRLTGEPLFPIDERPVPASNIPGESASPTQPFQRIDSLSPLNFPNGAMLGVTAQDDSECRKIVAGLRYEGIYTPPSFEGTLVFPGNLGGVNWGGAAFDPDTGTLYANTNRYAFSVKFSHRLAPEGRIGKWSEEHRKRFTAAVFLLAGALILVVSVVVRRRLRPGWVELALLLLVCVFLYRPALPTLPSSNAHFGRELGPQEGTPYTVLRQQIVAPSSGHPCTAMPWGTISAMNLNTGKQVFQTPLGTTIPGMQTGTVNLGGDIVIGSGLVFTAASEQPLLRAFDAHSGKELWQGKLPVPAQATPMTYTWKDRQYILIAAGGHVPLGTPISDAVVAFALPTT